MFKELKKDTLTQISGGGLFYTAGQMFMDYIQESEPSDIYKNKLENRYPNLK